MAPKKEPELGTRGGTRAIDMIRHSFMGERRCITIPEWKDPITEEPLDLWFGPVTPSAMEQVEERNPENNLARQLLLMVAMAQDEGGKPLFQYGDVKPIKDNTEFAVLQRVFDFMMASWLQKEDAKKKIKEDPTSDGDSNSPSA